MAVLSAALGLDVGDFLKGIKAASTEGTKFLSVFKSGMAEASKGGAGVGAALKAGLAGAKGEADLTKAALKDTLGSVSVEVDKVGFIKSLFGIEQAAEESAEKQVGSFGKVKQALQNATSQDGLKNVATTALGVVAGDALKSLASGVSGIASAMISGNAEIETYVTQLTTLQGSSQKAKDTIKELADFGASTPFELPEIVRAQKVLEGFGLVGANAVAKTKRSGVELRNAAGDIAAGTGQSFEEISLLIGKFASGATGEAISRFQELGIVTKEQLKGVGIEFDKAGSLTSPIDKALAATLDLAGEKFGGGMKALSNTYSGQLSTLSDNIGANLRDLGQPFFDLAKDVVAAMNEALGSDIFKQGVEIVKGLISTLLVPIRAIGSAFSSIKGAITGFSESLTEIGINGGTVLSMAAAFGVLVIAALKVRQIITMFRLLQLAISTIPAVMGFVTTAFPILGTVGNFVLNGLSAAARGLGASLLAISGTVLIVIGAIALVVTAVTLFFTKTELGQRIFAAFRATLIDFGKSVVQVFTEAYNNIGSFFNGVSGIVGNLGDIFTGKLSFGEAFKKGISDAEEAAKKAKFEQDLKDKIKALEPALARLGQIPIETDKLALLDDQIKKLGDTSTSAADKANISEAIARSVPGAVQGIKKIADENGNLVTVYDINIKKVQEYAEEQKKLLAGDQVAAIQKVKDGFAAQVTQLEQNKTALSGYAKQLGDVQKNIFDAQAKLRANPNDAGAKKQLDEAIKQQDDLKTKYKETKMAVDENTEALRGTVQQARSVGAVSKEEFTKLTEEVVKSKAAAGELVDALSTPIVPVVDLKKLAEQFDQALAGLKGKIETGVKASLQIDTKSKDVNKEIADLQTKLNEATAKGNKDQIDYVSGLIAAKQKEIKSLADAQKDANQQVRESSKEQSKEELRQKNRENELVYENRLKVAKEKAAKELENEKTLLDGKRRLLADPRERNTQELRDKLTLEEKKIEIDKRFGLLTQAEYGLALKDAKNRRSEFELDLLKLGDRFAKEDAERFRKVEDEKRKAALDSQKNYLSTLTTQDEFTAEKRKNTAVSITKLENEQRLRSFVEGSTEFQKRQAALLESAPKLKLNGRQIAEETEKILADLKKQFDDSQSSLYGTDVAEAYRDLADSNAKILKDTETKTQNELSLIKAKSIADGVEREYAVRIQQAIITRDEEIRLAGQNAAAVAQARLKYELDIIEATGNFRAAQAISTSRAEFELRKAQLDKQLQEELAKIGDNEERKLELIARISSQQSRLEADQLASENPLIRALFGVRETLYKDHYDNLEKAAEEKRKDSASKEKDALKREEDVLVAQLRTKEITLEQYNKRIREIQLRAKGLEAGGKEAKDIGEFLTRLGTLDVKTVLEGFYGSLRANAKDVLAPVFKAIADEGKAKLKVFEDTLIRRNAIQRDLDAIQLAQQSAQGDELIRLNEEYTRKVQEQVLVEESARQQQEQLLASVALTAAASFGNMLADGQSFGKSLVKTLFGLLKSLVPILVAQITGFSLASAESVATFGIAGVAKAAALTAALYAAVGLAESAVASALGGFRTGGFTGNKGEADVAGVVHGQEFVSTAQTTRRERHILEYIHTGKSSEDYFDEVHLPRRMNEIARAVHEAVQDVVTTVNAQVQAARIAIAETAQSVAPTARMVMQPMNIQAIIAATQTNELREIKQHLAAIERMHRQQQRATTNVVHNVKLDIETDHDALLKRVEEQKRREMIG